MVEFAKRDSHLPGKINEGYREGTEGNHEQDGYPALMLNLEQRTRKGDDDKARISAAVTLTACERARLRGSSDEWLNPTLLGAASAHGSGNGGFVTTY